MQQREENKQDLALDVALEPILKRVNDLKTSIASMLYKVENESGTMDWPSFLNNYAIISGQLTSLSKVLSQDKCPRLRNLTVLPLKLSCERDEELVQMTEHRVAAFAHDLVPDYLRTKADPMTETKMLHFDNKAASLSIEKAQKQIAAYQKVVTNVWEVISQARDEWEVKSTSRWNAQQNSSMTDTQLLVSAIGMGRGLERDNGQPNQEAGGVTVALQGQSQGPLPSNTQAATINKAPKAIKMKTKIKSARQVHPYGR